ncbi:MAG: P-II family nitrogen regulator, partial [Proteobacteria bacterium]|nr:P-II family nitrogen regulator [Pseudomonadota bacterium]
MKEIKAFVHQHRAADVIEAIKATQAWTAHAGAAEQ